MFSIKSQKKKLMNPILIYTAPRPNGTSATIAEKMNKEIINGIELMNLADGDSKEKLKAFDTLIFVAATYGDQELNDNVEDFIITLDDSISDYNYAVCEVGNYYGYDDFELGAGEILVNHMEKLGANSILPMYSVDSLPLLDEKKLTKWIAKLNNLLT